MVQLHGSTASLSQFSRTPRGSWRDSFIAIKACTSKLTPFGDNNPCAVIQNHEKVTK
uniref:Uncharacterized protein n=1 Tax=Rhizophora mucronata TaxID=61149 RepID=A0A2P2PYI6_RHIMU